MVQDSDPHKAREKPIGQPFYLHAQSLRKAQSLRVLGDPDVDVIDNNPGSNFAEGVHIGHKHLALYPRSTSGGKPQVQRVGLGFSGKLFQ